MTDMINRDVLLRINGEVAVDEVRQLIADANGWRAELKEKTDTTVFRVSAVDEDGQHALTAVRSSSPPNVSQPEVQVWMQVDGQFISPPLGHGYDFSLEVDTSAHSHPVPIGGGHFRIVEEGGGG